VSRDRIETTVVARFHYRHEGELAHGYLDSAGVNAVLLIDDAGGMDVGLAFVNPARIVVRVEDEARARAVLLDAGMLEDQ
jgi:ribosomal protein L21